MVEKVGNDGGLSVREERGGRGGGGTKRQASGGEDGKARRSIPPRAGGWQAVAGGPGAR